MLPDTVLNHSLGQHLSRFKIEEENQDPIVTTTAKVAVLIGALIAACLIILASTSQFLPFSAIGAIVIGGGELSLITILFFRYRNEYASRSEQRAHDFVENFLVCESPLEDETDFPCVLYEKVEGKEKEKEKESDLVVPLHGRQIRQLNFDHLADARHKDNLYCLNGAEEIQDHDGLLTLKRLPYIGVYSDTYYAMAKVALAASLPDPYLSNFPKEIQNFLADVKNPRLFFIVFQDLDIDLKEPRNLILHPLFFSNYKPSLPGIHKIDVRVGICRAKGIVTTNEISQDPEKWNLKSVCIHKGAFSPNNMRFYITNEEVCSFFVTAKYGDQGIACHFIRQSSKTEEGRKLEDALSIHNLQHFAEQLTTNEFKFAEEIGKTLTRND